MEGLTNLGQARVGQACGLSRSCPAERTLQTNGMIDHVTIQVDDVRRSREFYERLLAPLGIAALAEDGEGVGFVGRSGGGFWLIPARRKGTRELHVAFGTATRNQVREFHRAAVDVGAEVLHAPRMFEQYGPTYFAAFVRDPDGHNIEAVCRLADEPDGLQSAVETDPPGPADAGEPA